MSAYYEVLRLCFRCVDFFYLVRGVRVVPLSHHAWLWLCGCVMRTGSDRAARLVAPRPLAALRSLVGRPRKSSLECAALTSRLGCPRAVAAASRVAAGLAH